MAATYWSLQVQASRQRVFGQMESCGPIEILSYYLHHVCFCPTYIYIFFFILAIWWFGTVLFCWCLTWSNNCPGFWCKVHVGVELYTMPSFFFLHEPTAPYVSLVLFYPRFKQHLQRLSFSTEEHTKSAVSFPSTCPRRSVGHTLRSLGYEGGEERFEEDPGRPHSRHPVRRN